MLVNENNATFTKFKSIIQSSHFFKVLLVLLFLIYNPKLLCKEKKIEKTFTTLEAKSPTTHEYQKDLSIYNGCK